MTINMRSTVQLALAWLITMGTSAFAAANDVAAVPVEVLTIGTFQLGKSTLTDVGVLLGPAPSHKRDDGLVSTLCYFSESKHQFVAMQFYASVLGGLERLTGIGVRMVDGPPANCTRTNVNLGSMQLGGGATFGQSEKEFKAHIPVQFVRRGVQLVYKVEYQRKMTDEELTSMRQQWPDMPSPSFFEVVELIQARFRAGALQSYEVRRTESY
jgi:hypothetical protein